MPVELDTSVLLVDFDLTKQFVGWKQAAGENDDLLKLAINSVCSLIADYTDRQFVKEATPATRRFVLERDDVDEGSVMIDDLATLSGINVVLRDGTLVQTVDLSTVDEVKARTWRSSAPIEELQFNGQWVPGFDDFYRGGLAFEQPGRRPGYAIDVTGVWGWPAIPDQAVYWAMQTIAAWSTKDISRFAASFRLDTGRVEIPRVLPDAAKAGLQLFRRVPV